MCPLDYVPFIHQRTGEDSYKMDIKAIIQALIIAAVTGMIVMYGTQKSLMIELTSIKEDIAEVKHSVREIRKDIYVPRH